jgi:hypothetical protein
MNIHLRTLTSNIDHPSALTPVLRKQNHWPVSYSDTYIYESVIGHWYRSADDFEKSELTIWNWKSGIVVIVRPLYDFTSLAERYVKNARFSEFHISHFAFVTKSSYLLVSIMGNQDGLIELFTYNPDIQETQIARTVVALHLPPHHPMSIASRIYVRVAPYCGSTSMHGSLRCDPESRIFAFITQGCGADGTMEPIVFYHCFVHSRTFRRHLLALQETGVDGFEYATIPWMDWGPQEARVLQLSEASRLGRCV